jgi:hypothetical protein
MLCKKCNFQNEDSAKFCRNCGCELKEVSNTEEQKTPKPASHGNENASSPPSYIPKKEDNKSSTIGWFEIVIVIILLFIGIKNKDYLIKIYKDTIPNKTASLTWKLIDGKLTIDGDGTMPNYDIAPWDSEKNTITEVEIGYSVTNIGDNAFNGCKSLTSITPPPSNRGWRSYVDVKIIGDFAFKDCKNLIELRIPNVTQIGNSAFENCTSLTSIEIPNSVTSIGNHAFANCKNLKTVKFNCSIKEFLNIDKGVGTFVDCRAILKFSNNVNIDLNRFKGLTEKEMNAELERQLR